MTQHLLFETSISCSSGEAAGHQVCPLDADGMAMAMCASCQSIVPQSAGRCPICGNAPGISADDFIAELSPDSGADAPSAAGVAAPNGRVFTPPPLGDGPDDTTQTRSVGSPTIDEASARPRRSKPSRSELGSNSAPGMSPGLDSDDSTDLLTELGYGKGSMARTVRAISNRIDADIQVGPRRLHNMFATLAPLAAACIVAAGTYGAYNVMDLDRPVRTNPTEASAQPGTLAFTEAQNQAAADHAKAIENQIQELTALDCGVPISANAVSMSPTRLLTTASAVANETAPIVRFADGTTRIGTVVGTDIRTDVAVIEVASVPGVSNLDWGPVDLIVDEANREIVVVERFGSAVSGTPATAGSIEGRVGNLLSFDFSGAAFRPGSAVLNNSGYVIGMVDETGRRAIGSGQLSAALGRVIARPNGHSESCPIVDVESESDAEGTTTD